MFVYIQGVLSQKQSPLPPFFFLDSNRPYKDLLFPHAPNLAQKPLHLVGTVLKRERYLSLSAIRYLIDSEKKSESS